MTALPSPAPAPALRVVPQPRAAVYCRVSTRDQEQEGTSLESQEASCRAYAAATGHGKIKERTLRAKRRRAEAGQLHNGGVDFYGYRRDKERRTRRVEEAEATIVRQVYFWVAEGLSLGTIARRLTVAGTPPP